MPDFISAHLPYLKENGPIYPVIITPSFAAIELSKLEKKDVPYIKVRALFDTGAQTTAISEKVFGQLKLKPRGTVKVHTSQSDKIVNEYYIALEFDSNMYLNNLRVFAADLKRFSIDCLIGRDVLQFGVFIYDGPNKTLRLSFN